MKLKINISSFLGLLAAVFIGISTVCITGISYGRYSTSITNDVGFKASLPPEIYLIQTDAESNRMDFSPVWQTVGGEKCISFYLSNYGVADESAPEQNMKVRIRVFVPETVSEKENAEAVLAQAGTLAFSLHIGDTPVSYSSKISYLSEQTPMYIDSLKNTGDLMQGCGGWVYSFHSAALQEVSLTLPGGEFADIPITITVADVNTDTSNFVICVDRIK